MRVELVRQATRATSESLDGEVVVFAEAEGAIVWFDGRVEADVVALILLAGAVGEAAVLIASEEGAASAGM